MLRDELITAIGQWTQGLDTTVEPHTPLITSARLDSLQLFNLLTWIEERVGRPIDVTAIDITVEWDTVDAVVAFVKRERDGDSAT
jgi:acyl carrier protein